METILKEAEGINVKIINNPLYFVRTNKQRGAMGVNVKANKYEGEDGVMFVRN